jgi:hypothetical protein
MVVLIVFVINLSGSPKDAELWGFPSIITDILLVTKLAIILHGHDWPTELSGERFTLHDQLHQQLIRGLHALGRHGDRIFRPVACFIPCADARSEALRQDNRIP